MLQEKFKKEFKQRFTFGQKPNRFANDSYEVGNILKPFGFKKGTSISINKTLMCLLHKVLSEMYPSEIEINKYV